MRTIGIEGRHRLFDSLMDTATVGDVAGQESCDVILRDPHWHLFELDFKRRSAVFLRTGTPLDPTAVPFLYQALARAAQHAALIGFDDFLDGASRLPRPQRPIVNFFNIGHCGSTLVHNAINASGEAHCISEPKFLWSIAMNRNDASHGELAALANACITAVDRLPDTASRKPVFLKHFSQSTKVYDIWQRATPEAGNIYLYRDALAWCNSLYGFVQRVGLPPAMPRETREFNWFMMSGHEPVSYLKGLVDFDGERLDHWELFACAWGLHMQEYLSARSAGQAFHAFSYNELMRDRGGTLADLFRHCGMNASAVAKALPAFDHDAHEGEDTAHDKPVEKLTPAAYARIKEILLLPQLNFQADMTL